MKKDGEGSGRNGIKGGKMGGQDFITNKKKMKKNMQRLGGRGGLSLESFVNAKTRNDNYNPSLIKKQREFYKNAKCVQKYKRSLKQRGELSLPSTYRTPVEDVDEANESDYVNQQQEQLNLPSTDKTRLEFLKLLRRGNITNEGNDVNQNKKNTRSLEELYKKKREEEEKARKEKELIIQKKKEERQQSEARRRALKEKMYKKTKSGQPVMKYRIEHLLETIQGATS